MGCVVLIISTLVIWLTDWEYRYLQYNTSVLKAFLHVLADALGIVVVIISALVIWLTDWEYRYL